MEYETAGDPITGLKWTRRTTHKIAEELKLLGIQVCRNTVGKLLKKMGFSLRVNHKKIGTGGKNKSESRKNRDTQFAYIGRLRETYEKEGNPVISIDTKKKEMIGNFKNPGISWNQEPICVNDHDFRSYAVGMGIPYGIYDTLKNTGSIFVGTSYDTPEFSVESIESWWLNEGKKQYSNSQKILILADCGGSNHVRSRVWKNEIQEKLCDTHGISVTVTHYPPGTSKWNPIEHRLFSEISKNWAGKPLESYETMLNYIRTTKTSKGLKVNAYLIRKEYRKGQRISDDQMSKLSITQHEDLPKWNYTLTPRKM